MLYYTGAEKYNEEQQLPSQSLGGYCSSTSIDNDEFGNIIDQVSDVVNYGVRHRMVVFKNPYSTPITDIKIWSDDGEVLEFELSVVLPSSDQNDNPIFESIKKDSSKPYQAQFRVADQDNPFTIESLDPQQEIGIWLKSKINDEFITNFDIFYNAPVMEDEQPLESLQIKNQDEFKLHIEWLP